MPGWEVEYTDEFGEWWDGLFHEPTGSMTSTLQSCETKD